MESNEEKENSNNDKSAKKPYQRYKYDKHDLYKAIQAVRSCNATLNAAALLYNIPKSTLHAKVHEKVPQECSVGRQSILTAEEELRLEKWIIGKAELGFPMHPDEVKNAVQRTLQDSPRENPFKGNRPGDKWLGLFLKRHPLIKKRNTEVISKARASVTEEGLRDWFAETEKFFGENDASSVMHNPRCIFNGDETGIQMSPKSGLLLGPKEQRNFYEISAGHEKENVTVLFTFSAAGEALPPLIMYPYKRIPAHIAESVPSGWPIGRSDSGWMVSASFYEYVANIFYPWLLANNVPFPVVYYLDGHKSHLNERLADFCLEHKIILYCLPPNSTHIMQPCDVSVFKALKAHWRTAVHEYKQKTQKSMTKANFAPTLKLAFDKFLENTEVIKNGFKRCGLYPFDNNAPDYTKCISKRRKDFFTQPDTENSQVSDEDFAVTRKVIEHVIGPSNAEIFANMRSSRTHSKAALYLLWKVCFDRATGPVLQEDYKAVCDALSLETEESRKCVSSYDTSGIADFEDENFGVLVQSIDVNNYSTILDCDEDILSFPFDDTSNDTSRQAFETPISRMTGNSDETTGPIIDNNNCDSSTVTEVNIGEGIRFNAAHLRVDCDDQIVVVVDNNNHKLSNDSQIESANCDENCVITLDENGNNSANTNEIVIHGDEKNFVRGETERNKNNDSRNSNDANEQQREAQEIVISKSKGASSDVWEKHLHWPEPQDQGTRRPAKKPMPYALTSEKWKEHFELQRQKEAEKLKIAAQKSEMRRLKKEANEREAAERLEKRRLKKEAADAARAEKAKIQEEKAKLRVEKIKIKQEKGIGKQSSKKKSEKNVIPPVQSTESTEELNNTTDDGVDEIPTTSRKRDLDTKKRSNEPIPKTCKED